MQEGIKSVLLMKAELGDKADAIHEGDEASAMLQSQGPIQYSSEHHPYTSVSWNRKASSACLCCMDQNMQSDWKLLEWLHFH